MASDPVSERACILPPLVLRIELLKCVHAAMFEHCVRLGRNARADLDVNFAVPDVQTEGATTRRGETSPRSAHSDAGHLI